MKKLKMVVLALGIGCGFGLSQAAFASPDPDWCMDLASECRDGNQAACSLFYTYCHG